jgi:RimJ/RimL family protein N-acetyltransferase
MSNAVSFRDIQPEDFDDLHAMASDWEIVRQLGSWPWPPEPEFTRGRSKPYEGDGFVHGAFLTGRMIGTVAVTNGVVGYNLHRDFWRQGYGSQMMRHALGLGFGRGHERLIAEVWHDNAASQALLRKFGFQLTGQTVEFAKARKEDTLSLTFELTKDDWTAQQSLSS